MELFIRFVCWFKTNNYPIRSIGFTGNEGMGTIFRLFLEQNKGVDEFLNVRYNQKDSIIKTSFSF